jgi:hypothetical protein
LRTTWSSVCTVCTRWLLLRADTLLLPYSCCTLWPSLQRDSIPQPDRALSRQGVLLTI